MVVPYFKDYYYAAQLRVVSCWCDEAYIARWKDIETKGEGCQIQTLQGDRELFREQRKLLDPITKFTLKTFGTG